VTDFFVPPVKDGHLSPSIKPHAVAALKAEGLGATEIAKRLKIGRARVLEGV
jgi:hypothetical protein